MKATFVSPLCARAAEKRCLFGARAAQKDLRIFQHLACSALGRRKRTPVIFNTLPVRRAGGAKVWVVPVLASPCGVGHFLAQMAPDLSERAQTYFMRHLKHFSVLFHGIRSPCGVGHFLPKMAPDSSERALKVLRCLGVQVFRV